jgi:GrpB-like predicted nucleotidyltransferase (UPF0157 family)
VTGTPSLVLGYDPDWPRLFERERTRLEQALASWLEGGVHHVGSTAVPGLAARPIIDMVAGVRDLDHSRDALEPLGKLGYTYRVHRPESHSFHRPGYHLHLTEPGSDIWRERLAFRDALRADRELRHEYEDWKLEHIADEPSAGAYTQSKWAFVARVLAATGIELKPDAQRLAAEAFTRPVDDGRPGP